MTNTIFSVPLLILDHYDSLLNQIDVYTEQQLEKYTEDDLLKDRFNRNESKNEIYQPNEYSLGDTFQMKFENISIQAYEDPYSDKYNYAECTSTNPRFLSQFLKVRDYLNMIRLEAIGEIKKAQQEHLDYYEANKSEFKLDDRIMTKELIKNLKKEIFSKKYCFLLELEQLCVIEQVPNASFFKLHTVVTDFYLEECEEKILR